MPARRGAGRGGQRRAPSSEASSEESDDASLVMSDSSHSAPDDTQVSFLEAQLNQDRDFTEALVCPFCGASFVEEEGIPEEDRLSRHYLLSSHIWSVHPEEGGGGDSTPSPAPDTQITVVSESSSEAPPPPRVIAKQETKVEKAVKEEMEDDDLMRDDDDIIPPQRDLALPKPDVNVNDGGIAPKRRSFVALPQETAKIGQEANGAKKPLNLLHIPSNLGEEDDEDDEDDEDGVIPPASQTISQMFRVESTQGIMEEEDAPLPRLSVPKVKPTETKEAKETEKPAKKAAKKSAKKAAKKTTAKPAAKKAAPKKAPVEKEKEKEKDAKGKDEKESASPPKRKPMLQFLSEAPAAEAVPEGVINVNILFLNDHPSLKRLFPVSCTIRDLILCISHETKRAAEGSRIIIRGTEIKERDLTLEGAKITHNSILHFLKKTGQSAPAFGPEEAKAAAEVHRRIAQEIGVPVKLAGQKRKGSDEGEASPTSASASVSPPPAGAESPKAKKARVDAPAAVSPPPQLPQAHPVEESKEEGRVKRTRSAVVERVVTALTECGGSEEAAAETGLLLEQAVWRHRGLVLADPYRKHMRILFHLGNTAAGKDVLSGKLSVEDCIKLSDVTKYTG